MKNDILNTEKIIKNSFSYSYLPHGIKKTILVWNYLFIITFIVQLIGWFFALYVIEKDIEQGNIYRIMFVHVPVAWCAFFWILMGAIFSVFYLFFPKKSHAFDLSAHAAMQLGVVFSFLVLATGSIWGRPTWGVWWDWDPRLTSSLVMFVVACGYLVIRQTTEDLAKQQKMSAFVAILCAINVPIVYYSVNLWRSLHQPQSFVQQSATNMSSDIVFTLLYNSIALFLLSISMYKIRRQGLSAKDTLFLARKEVQE